MKNDGQTQPASALKRARMYKSRFIWVPLFFGGMVLVVKFIFDVANHPTDPFIVATLFFVIMGFGNVRDIVLLPELSEAALEAVDRLVKRYFKLVLIFLFINSLANIIYPATGVLTTILTWVLGHTAVAIWVGSAAALQLLRRIDKQIKDNLMQSANGLK